MELNGTGAGCLIVCVALITAVWTIPKACSDIKEMDAAYNKEDTRGEFKDIELEHGVQKNGVRGMNSAYEITGILTADKTVDAVAHLLSCLVGKGETKNIAGVYAKHIHKIRVSVCQYASLS